MTQLSDEEKVAAVRVMTLATSWFVQDPYATEAIDALEADGWVITPPAGTNMRTKREP